MTVLLMSDITIENNIVANMKKIKGNKTKLFFRRDTVNK